MQMRGAIRAFAVCQLTAVRYYPAIFSRRLCTPALSESDEAVLPGVRQVSERTKKVVAYRQKYLCAACNCLLPPTYQVDHIEPVALGGTNGLGNLQVSS